MNINQDLFIQGVKNGLDSTNILIEFDKIDPILREFFQKKQKADQEKQQAEALKKVEIEFGENKLEGEKFLELNIRLIFLDDVYNNLNLDSKLPSFRPSFDEIVNKKSSKFTNEDNIFKDIKNAFLEMPLTMKQLIPVKFFTWYAMFCYWQYITGALSISLWFWKIPSV